MIRLEDTQAQILVNFLNGLGGNVDETIGAVRQIITNQLAQPSYDRDMIAVIRDIIKKVPGDRGQQVLSSGRLERLRQSLFTPRELFVLQYQTNVLSCVGCGHTFTDYETGTVADGRFYCTSCRIPEYVDCHCGSKIYVGDGFAKACRGLIKACKMCQNIREGKVPPAQPLGGAGQAAAAAPRTGSGNVAFQAGGRRPVPTEALRRERERIERLGDQLLRSPPPPTLRPTDVVQWNPAPFDDDDEG